LLFRIGSPVYSRPERLLSDSIYNFNIVLVDINIKYNKKFDEIFRFGLYREYKMKGYIAANIDKQ
jgi:hypothetical protein